MLKAMMAPTKHSSLGMSTETWYHATQQGPHPQQRLQLCPQYNQFSWYLYNHWWRYVGRMCKGMKNFYRSSADIIFRNFCMTLNHTLLDALARIPQLAQNIISRVWSLNIFVKFIPLLYTILKVTHVLSSETIKLVAVGGSTYVNFKLFFLQ